MSAICSICGSSMTVQDREGTAFCYTCENEGLRARIRELEAAQKRENVARSYEHAGLLDCYRLVGHIANVVKGNLAHDPYDLCQQAFRSIEKHLADATAALKGETNDEG